MQPTLLLSCLMPRVLELGLSVTYTYFVLRLDTLRPGSSCETRKSVMDFIEFFYESTMVEVQMKEHGFAPLPEIEKELVLDLIKANFKCNGAVVYVDPDPPVPIHGIWDTSTT